MMEHARPDQYDAPIIMGQGSVHDVAPQDSAGKRKRPRKIGFAIPKRVVRHLSTVDEK